MAKIKIDHDVPMPDDFEDTLSALKPGDSFFHLFGNIGWWQQKVEKENQSGRGRFFAKSELRRRRWWEHPMLPRSGVRVWRVA